VRKSGSSRDDGQPDAPVPPAVRFDGAFPRGLRSLLIDHAYDAIFTWEPGGPILSWNRGAELMFGFPAREAVGVLPDTLLGPGSTTLQPSLTDDGVWEGQLVHRRQDGRELVIEARRLLVDVDDRPVVLEIGRDVTERVRAEEELRHSEATLRGFYESSPVLMGVVELLEDDILHLYDNPATCRFYEAPPGATIGRLASELGTSREVLKIWIDQYRACAAQGRPVQFEYQHGDAGWLSVIVSRIEAGPARPRRFTYVATNITARKEMEAALRDALATAQEASRTKGEFLSTMSHELRTPMQAIVGYTDLLLAGMSGPVTPQQTADLEIVATSAQQMLMLINEILDFSRVESGRIDPDRQPVDLVGLAAEVVALLRPGAESKGLVLALETGDVPVIANADRGMTRQIVTNLAGNAIKFTDGGSVTVRVQQAGPIAALEVADTGIGIEPRLLGAIFEPFRQADGSSTRRYGGTGLGLAISNRLARALDGAITVESEPGRGSTFRLELPVAPD
jgi:PAS domain S-box-containing protein